jgi:hypothetical protein
LLDVDPTKAGGRSILLVAIVGDNVIPLIVRAALILSLGMFDKKLFSSHLERARGASSDCDAFDALWKAFNVYYESLFERGQRQELDRVHLAAKALTQSDYRLVLTQATIHQLITIAPVFNERDWQRKGTKNAGEHVVVKSALAEVSRGRAPTEADVISLLTLLYVIRCNMVHGFKTPDGPRDRDVLSAANRVFTPFMKALAHRLL